MKYLKTLSLITVIVLGYIVVISSVNSNETTKVSEIELSTFQDIDTSEWVAPDSANELENPMEADEETLEEGMLIYKKSCRSCHGKLGDGKGSGAVDLEVAPTDFTQSSFAAQTDGSIFWKTQTGRNEMKSYKEKLDEEEIWMVVIYIRSLAQADAE